MSLALYGKILTLFSDSVIFPNDGENPGTWSMACLFLSFYKFLRPICHKWLPWTWSHLRGDQTRQNVSLTVHRSELPDVLRQRWTRHRPHNERVLLSLDIPSHLNRQTTCLEHDVATRLLGLETELSLAVHPLGSFLPPLRRSGSSSWVTS